MEKVINGILVESRPEIKADSCEGCHFKNNSFFKCRRVILRCTATRVIWAPKNEINDTAKLTAEYTTLLYKRPISPLETMLKSIKEPPTPSHLTNRHFVDNLWRWKCGMEELEETPFEPVNIAELAKTQMSSRFVELMTNRMVLGTLRYGRWQDNKKNGVKYDRVGSIRRRLDLFEKTGNSEYLVDIANFAMIEFEISDHPNLHFSPKDDDGEHVQKILIPKTK